MSLTPIEVAFIAGGFTVLGALIGAWITYWFALKLSVKNARREAGRRLRETFTSELSILDPETGDKNVRASDLLEAALPKHRDAITEFAFYLSDKEKPAYEAAWRAYHEGECRRYMGIITTDTGADGQRIEKTWSYEQLKQQVHDILKFTY
jgi:hypothetical protein